MAFIVCGWDGAAAASGGGEAAAVGSGDGTSRDETRRDESSSITSLYVSIETVLSCLSIESVLSCLSKSIRYPFGNVTPIASEGGVVIRRTSDSEQRCSKLTIVSVYTCLSNTCLIRVY